MVRVDDLRAQHQCVRSRSKERHFDIFAFTFSVISCIAPSARVSVLDSKLRRFLRQCTEECVSRILFNSDNTFWLRAVPFIFLCDLCTCVIHFWYSVFGCNDLRWNWSILVASRVGWTFVVSTISLSFFYYFKRIFRIHDISWFPGKQ